MARRIRSGTLVGPGTWRKGRPGMVHSTSALHRFRASCALPLPARRRTRSHRRRITMGSPANTTKEGKARGAPESSWSKTRRIPIVIIALTSIFSPAAAQDPPVRLGIDTFLSEPAPLQGRRVGLVTHQAGVTREGHPTAVALTRIAGVKLTALFAPEHGLDGSYGAGQPVPTIPGRTPVYSLYGGTFRPTRGMLARVDVLVVDLQDVGSRPYTYASTMAMVMQAAREAGKPGVVFDRPNPQGGVIIDGPILEPQFRSFIGLYPIPMVHGVTIGELARLYNDAFGIGAN